MFSPPSFTLLTSSSITKQYTLPTVWFVSVCPSESLISSQFPWSDVRSMEYSFSLAFSIILPRQASTVSTAFIAASKLPVCPTISPLAKLTTTNPYSSSIALSTASATSSALICGFSSYVFTFGLCINTLVSFGYGVSTPPLRKKVTCAYFSVSAVCS